VLVKQGWNYYCWRV